MPNPYGKTRKQDEPYATYRSADGEWEWKILKTYQTPDKGKGDMYARAFCAVKGSGTFGSYELGDTYLNDIGGTLVQGVDILKEYGRR